MRLMSLVSLSISPTTLWLENVTGDMADQCLGLVVQPVKLTMELLYLQGGTINIKMTQRGETERILLAKLGGENAGVASIAATFQWIYCRWK